MSELVKAFIRILPFIILVIVICIRIKSGKLKPGEILLQKPVSAIHFLLWTSGFLLLICGIEFALYKANLLVIEPWKHTLLPSIVRIAGAVIFAPVAEEILFRGIILNKLLQKKIKFPLAIVIQAVLFVIVHSFTYQNTITSNIAVAQTFLDATLYALAAYSTKSLYTPITMHMTGNAIATLERFIFV